MKQTFPVTFFSSKEKVASFFGELFLLNHFSMKVYHTLFAPVCPCFYDAMDSFPIRGRLLLGKVPLLEMLLILFFANVSLTTFPSRILD